MNANVREYVTDAIKFWERWRLIYNLALAAVAIIHFAAAAALAFSALAALCLAACGLLEF